MTEKLDDFERNEASRSLRAARRSLVGLPCALSRFCTPGREVSLLMCRGTSAVLGLIAADAHVCALHLILRAKCKAFASLGLSDYSSGSVQLARALACTLARVHARTHASFCERFSISVFLQRSQRFCFLPQRASRLCSLSLSLSALGAKR